jgi:hypothetical protein
MNNVFNLNDARRARNFGMDLAAKKAANKIWISKAVIIITCCFPKGWEGLAERFQPLVSALIGKPDPYQLWGNVSNYLIINKVFEHIERDPEVYRNGVESHKQCEKVSSHGCDGKIMRKL